MISIFPGRREWPPALADAAQAPRDASTLRFVGGAKNFDQLKSCTQLKSLWCFDIDARALEAIGACASLEAIYIDNLKADNLGPLRNLVRLTTLSIDTCSKMTSLEPFTTLGALTGLALTHFKNIHDLQPLSQLTSLRELAVAGSIWTRMRVASFAPLSALTALEWLHLTNIKPDDESLRPLGPLKNLKTLDLANFYSAEEFGWLSRQLPSTECSWFAPYLAVASATCKKCGKNTMVMLTGNKKPMLCQDCDRARLDKHLQEWNRPGG